MSIVGSCVVVITLTSFLLLANKENKDRKERLKKLLDQIKKKNKKCCFINKFIDEIPELSYYEAAQLKKKLGKIYVEWNDE